MNKIYFRIFCYVSVIILCYSNNISKRTMQLNFPAVGWTSFFNLYCHNCTFIFHTTPSIKLQDNSNLTYLFGPTYSQIQPSTSQKLRSIRPNHSYWIDVLKYFEVKQRPIVNNFKCIYRTEMTTNSHLFKSSKIFPNVSLMIFDSITPFISHFFHFLEHIIPIYYTLVTQNISSSSIETIIFPNSNYPEIIGTGI